MAQPTRDRDIWPPLSSLSDIAARRYNLRLRCPACRYERVLSGPCVWWLFERRGWRQDMAKVAERFWCQHCRIGNRRKVRPTVAQTRDDPTGEGLPRPSEAEWKRLVSRYRC